MRLDGFGLLVEDIMRSYTLKKGRHLKEALRKEVSPFRF